MLLKGDNLRISQRLPILKLREKSVRTGATRATFRGEKLDDDGLTRHWPLGTLGLGDRFIFPSQSQNSCEGYQSRCGHHSHRNLLRLFFSFDAGNRSKEV
jgi:hypothetical protein